jgi:hypothetical protein
VVPSLTCQGARRPALERGPPCGTPRLGRRGRRSGAAGPGRAARWLSAAIATLLATTSSCPRCTGACSGTRTAEGLPGKYNTVRFDSAPVRTRGVLFSLGLAVPFETTVLGALGRLPHYGQNGTAPISYGRRDRSPPRGQDRPPRLPRPSRPRHVTGPPGRVYGNARSTQRLTSNRNP